MFTKLRIDEVTPLKLLCLGGLCIASLSTTKKQSRLSFFLAYAVASLE